MADPKDLVRDRVTSLSDDLIGLSHDIHAHPELMFEETYACDRVATMLENAGFTVDRGIANIPTAFRATFGSGELNIGICAEYDALPNVGHACGHNIIAATSVGTALALQPLADQLGITVTVLGTPAEEGDGGKILMLQRGAFDGLNAALMVHPSRDERDEMPTLALRQIVAEFIGVAAHAAAAPDRGRNALSAIVLAQSGIAMLREHFVAGDRVHGVIKDGGGAQNVIPPYTKGRWSVRAATTERTEELYARVIDIFRGAALMTGCTLKISHPGPAYSELRTDTEIAAFWRANAGTLGRSSIPISTTDRAASTDMGNVSYAVPSIHPLIALESGDATIHEAEFARFTAAPTGDQAVIDGANALAMTVIDIATDPEMRKRLLSKHYSVTDVNPDEPYLDSTWNDVINFDPLSFGSISK